LAKTANRLAVIFILPTATANRLGGGGYFYNRRFETAFEFRFWAGFRPVLGRVKIGFGLFLHLFWARFTPVLGHFLYRFFGPFFCTDFLGRFFGPFFVQIFQEKKLILFGPFVLCYKITNPNIF